MNSTQEGYRARPYHISLSAWGYEGYSSSSVPVMTEQASGDMTQAISVGTSERDERSVQARETADVHVVTVVMWDVQYEQR